MASNKLKIIPLGGVDEVGKNLTVLEYDNDIIVIDCGSIFPNDDLLGIDLVIPDVSYLKDNIEKVRGFIFTHGHEDHIGAVPYVMKQIKAPLYASKLTLALIDIKLKENRLNNVQTNLVKANDIVELGCFKIQFINVNHSIPGAMGLIIDTPVGKVVVSGDFKIDYTPPQGEVTNLAAFAKAGGEGVLAMLCESTNIEHEGHTISESEIASTFESLFDEAEGRIIIAMFASNVHRLQMAIDCAVKRYRRICFVGRSMVNVAQVAMEINELDIPDGFVIDADDISKYDDNEILILTTGSQGEPMAGLTRMAFGEHRKIRIYQNDTVILSSSPIPGNEKNTAKVLNQLYRCGAKVIYNRLAHVHSSGHACKEELMLLHTLVRPKFFIPVHGEYRMLWQHSQLAIGLGLPAENTLIPEAGQVIEFDENSMKHGGYVSNGALMVDGLCIGDVGDTVLRDRRHLGEDGVIIISLAFDRDEGKLVAGPDIISRGFIHIRDNDDFLTDLNDMVRNIILQYQSIDNFAFNDLRTRLRNDLRKSIYTKIKRNPMIIPIIMSI